ncbi:MAG TPA: Wzz/FepE/Etk N-terminal domain-containing protein, partial [Chitinophagaceae bacterium]|nr:Wzz/FepE/Etk N-terminal domain-containing protein [Chitinophagaceae bacterium]
MAAAHHNPINTGAEYKTAGVEHLEALIRLIFRKWWLFLIIGIVAGLAGIYYASQQKIAYQSKLTFALDQAGGESNLMSFAAQFGFSFGGNNDVFAGDNIIEIMQSRRIVE